MELWSVHCIGCKEMKKCDWSKRFMNSSGEVSYGLAYQFMASGIKGFRFFSEELAYIEIIEITNQELQQHH